MSPRPSHCSVTHTKWIVMMMVTIISSNVRNEGSKTDFGVNNITDTLNIVMIECNPKALMSPRGCVVCVNNKDKRKSGKTSH